MRSRSEEEELVDAVGGVKVDIRKYMRARKIISNRAGRWCRSSISACQDFNPTNLHLERVPGDHPLRGPTPECSPIPIFYSNWGPFA